ncbi:MAG: hypothetical protein WCD35_17855 [Mycobacteriales bacterium]
MGTTTLTAVAASPWAAAGTAERFGNAPFALSQGTGLPFAGYRSAAAVKVAVKAAAAHLIPMTDHGTAAVVRQDDDRVPPRGRPL